MSNSEETNLVRKIMLQLGKNPKIRIFRNNVGKCWIGASKKFTKPTTVNVKSGDVLIENASESSCMASGLHFSSDGLQGYTLDHCHSTGLIRGVLRADINIFLGRIEKYFNKILGKTGLSLTEVLEGLLSYLESSEEDRQTGNYTLDFRIVDAELKRISRWKTETIFNKLKNKLELLPVEEYTRQQVTEAFSISISRCFFI